jgi:CDP-6-deoxy-D-xylo-4-hexulose-3-dehydrase
MTSYRDAILAEWQRRAALRGPAALFPLIGDSFDHREIVAAVEVLLSGRLTMGEETRRFEQAFAQRVGAPFAVMVNSGSSANLIAVAAACAPGRERRLMPGDEVLVPAVCWSTSVWPLVQYGLRPVFVDVDPRTLNADPADLERRVTPKTRAIVAVHVLGNSTPIPALHALAERHGLLLIEDTCESLGSTFEGRVLGTLGDFGTYSFYFSHHITTGEGGMVVCRTQADADLLRSLRAHGWSRDLSNRAAVEQQHADVDPRFLFVHAGYNVRPLDLQAAIGQVQLARLTAMNETRNRNRERLIAALRGHPRWDGRFEFTEASPETAPAWFGFTCLLSPHFRASKGAFLAHLTASGVENRPVISGNFTRQPALRDQGIVCTPADYPGAESIDRWGFFIGIHTEVLSDELVGMLAGILLAPEDEIERSAPETSDAASRRTPARAVPAQTISTGSITGIR